ncbi:uncharacterized protein [Anabrus simplex]|uniref:uncharacterized protein isoform X2 n=1 Tax=Anabrus simplex TaxID=316456 RepID=UPI0035A3984B
MAKTRKHECSVNHLTATAKIHDLQSKREGENEFTIEVKTEDHSDDINSQEGCTSESLTKEVCTEEPTCSAFADVEIALLRLRQEKLLLELEKLFEERKRIAAEKKNAILRSEILKLRLQLTGRPTLLEMGINCDGKNVGTEDFQEIVNVSVSRCSIPQIHDTSMGKPKCSVSSVGTQVCSAQLSGSQTAGSVCPDNSVIKTNSLSNINSAPVHKQSLSTSNYPVTFHPINRHVLSDNLGSLCLLPVSIPCSASHFPGPLLNIGDLSPMTHVNIFQTGIDNMRSSGESGSSQIGLVLQDCESQQQNLQFAKPASQSTPATNNTSITGSNPQQVASNKTMRNQMENSSQLNSSCQLDGSRKELESTDDFIVPHPIDSLLERDEGIVVSASNSTAGNVPRVKEKVDAGGPSKKLRLSTEDSR